MSGTMQEALVTQQHPAQARSACASDLFGRDRKFRETWRVNLRGSLQCLQAVANLRLAYVQGLCQISRHYDMS